VDTRLLQFQLSLNVVSFVDRDIVMRYFGGGIGHLKNTPPLQVPGFDPIDPGSDEMAVEDDDDEPCSGSNHDDDLDAVVQQPSKDVVMNGGELVQLEVGEDDEEDEDDEDDSDDDEGGDQTDDSEDGDSEGEDDNGYATA
jgi:hypothetical protein